ncbi:MAG: hypothetical protein ACTSP1_05535, partial [Candidatus Freyarchaeota archaeon]
MSSHSPREYIGERDFAEPLKLRGSQLYFEDSSIERLAETLGTRVYILSLKQVERNAKRLTEAFKNYSRFKPCYALAANSLPQVAQTLVNLGFGVEVVNIHELNYTLSALQNVPSIICNGVSKHTIQNQQNKTLIQTVIDLQKETDITLNLNSIEEIKYAKKLCEKRNTELKVGLALNPASHSPANFSPGTERFGIPTDQLPAAVKLIKNSKLKLE